MGVRRIEAVQAPPWCARRSTPLLERPGAERDQESYARQRRGRPRGGGGAPRLRSVLAGLPRCPPLEPRHNRATCRYVLDLVIVASRERPCSTAGSRHSRASCSRWPTWSRPNLDGPAARRRGRVHVEGMARAARPRRPVGGASRPRHWSSSDGSARRSTCYNGALVQFAHRRIDTRRTHGTGCTLSAAIAARLALGDDAIAVATAR